MLSEVWEDYASCLILFPLVALAILGLLWFHIKKKYIYVLKIKNYITDIENKLVITSEEREEGRGNIEVGE